MTSRILNFTGPLHRFPVPKDRIVGRSPTLDRTFKPAWHLAKTQRRGNIVWTSLFHHRGSF